jgi:L-fuconolactonase
MESFRDLPAVIAVAGRCPDVRFVVEGLGAPPIATDELEPWRTRLRELAKCDNVVCVTNGVATPAASARLQHEARLWPYFDTAVQAFGPRRLMFGSGWPQLCGAWTYAGWFEAFEAWIEVLTEDDQARILGGTAREVFALG